MSRVYFLRVGDDGPIKIGWTSGEIEDRVAALQIGCPWKLRVIGAVDGELRHESWLHRRFSEVRLEGEWFTPVDELLSAIDSILDPAFVWPEAEIPPHRLHEILSRWPSVHEFARDIGIKPSHAQTMKARKSIPAAYWLRVVRAAKSRGFVDISAEVLARIHARERAAS